MRLELLQSLQIIIIALLSYVPTVTIAGWFEAWVAKKCGDDVPEQFGFLTFNPMAHVNVMGFAFLLIGKLMGDTLPLFRGIPGWGRYIPLAPDNHSGAKILIQFHARAIAHFILAVVALFGIVRFLKMGLLDLEWNLVSSATSQSSSLVQIVQFFFNQNLMLCIIYFAIGTFRSIMTYFLPDFYEFSSQHVIWGMLILFGAIIIFAETFRYIIAKCMVYLLSLLLII